MRVGWEVGYREGYTLYAIHKPNIAHHTTSIHYTKGDAVTEELYITLYIITDSTRHNKMHFILLQIVQDTTRCVENEEMRGTPH